MGELMLLIIIMVFMLMMFAVAIFAFYVSVVDYLRARREEKEIIEGVKCELEEIKCKREMR